MKSESLGAPASPPAFVKKPTRTSALPHLTPKLRFPEFRNETRWDSKRLDEVCAAITQGGTPDTSVAEYWNGDVCWITPAEMGKSDSPFVETTERKITEEGLKNCSSILLPINSVILSTRAPIGHLAINRTPMAINQGCKGLIPSSELDFRFLYFSLASNKRRLNDLGSGNTFKELSGSALKAFSALFPRLAEQQKIAECLSTLDELIGAESQKLDALKAHKKGLMQQLFPREGETRPRLRFPEFHSAPEWDVKPFDEFVAKSFYGTSSSTSPQGQYPVLRMGNMADGGLDFTNLVYIDLDRESFESFRLEDGDILLNRTNSPALVGKISLFRLKSECLTASYIVTYRLKKERLDPAFCNFMLNTPLYQAKIRSLAKPSISQANINPTAFRKEIIVSVPEPAEQHRIATCLSSLDELIAAQSDRLSALQTHKQGLLQQLFPSPADANA